MIARYSLSSVNVNRMSKRRNLLHRSQTLKSYKGNQNMSGEGELESYYGDSDVTKKYI